MGGGVDGSVFPLAVTSAGAMLVLASGLSRRKRRAWALTLVAVTLGAPRTSR